MPRRLQPSKWLLIVLSLAAVFSAAGQSVRAQRHPRDAKQEITELEQQWRAATLSGDVTVMDRLLSDDYVGISWTGQVNNKMSQIERLRSRAAVINKMDMSDFKVKVVGSVAIVTAKASVEGTSDGATIDGGFLYTRIYQRQASGMWKITNFEATRQLKGNRHRHGTDTASAGRPG